jgi:hypothetical protein
MEIQTNPSIPKPEYKKLAVLVNSADIEERRTGEKIFIKSLAKKGIAAESCIEVFPTIKDYSDKEIKDIASILNEHKIQAVLIIDIEFSGIIYNLVYYLNPSPSSVSTSPSLINTAYTKYIVKVVDLATGKNSFYATADATGGADTIWEALLHSLANKTIQTMQKNSIIKPVK